MRGSLFVILYKIDECEASLAIDKVDSQGEVVIPADVINAALANQ